MCVCLHAAGYRVQDWPPAALFIRPQNKRVVGSTLASEMTAGRVESSNPEIYDCFIIKNKCT